MSFRFFLIFGTICFVAGIITTTFGVLEYGAMLSAIEYDKTHPHHPLITYENFWERIGISIVLFTAGGILLIINRKKRDKIL
jgi:prolipoprotein diacylglyceryltransferase